MTVNRLAPSADDTFWFKQLENILLSLIEICDSFDQLGKIASLCDLLYSSDDPEYPVLFRALERTARHLKGLPVIGGSEIGR